MTVAKPVLFSTVNMWISHFIICVHCILRKLFSLYACGKHAVLLASKLKSDICNAMRMLVLICVR
jgi:hypothetical protein